ncbi:MAG: hypothetical protein ABFR82_17100 [Nitrospirota bacterium]
MKTTKKIWLKKVLSTIGLVVLALGILMVLSMHQITLTAHAQSYPNHIIGWHGAMASLAEKEIRTKQQKVINNVRAIDNTKANIDTNTTVVDDDGKKHLICPKETVSEKEMKC